MNKKDFENEVKKAIENVVSDVVVRAIDQDMGCNGCSNTVRLEVRICINGVIEDLVVVDRGDVFCFNVK